MKANLNLRRFLVVTIIGLIFALSAFAQTTQFIYQGRLNDSSVSSPTNGLYDMEFNAFDASANGNQLGATNAIPNVRVIGGVFTVALDFGSQTFGGSDVFLEISVRPALSANPFTVLNPRQMFTSAPYSLRSLNSLNAANADNSANLGGIAANQFVQTVDSRLSDARNPLAGNANYIQNSTAVQSSSNFNVSGNGNVGGTLSGNIVNAATQFNINSLRVFATDANDNLFAGKTSGAANSSGGSNSFFGTNAGAANTSGNSNSFFGRSAGQSNINGVSNSFFGFNSGVKNLVGSNNSFFGLSSGFNNLSDNNSFFGFSAGQANANGNNNAFFGSFAGFSNTNSDNSFFGANAGQKNVGGTGNSFFGRESGRESVDGNSNSFFGRSAGLLNTSGDQNTFFGFNAGQSNTTGSSNTLFGSNAGNGSPVGMFNSTAVGFGAIPQGNQVTVVGYQAGSSTGIIDSTAIGANAFVSTSNTVVIGTASTTTENPGLLKVLTLGAAGSTSLCCNSQNQISTCTAGNYSGTSNKLLETLRQQNLQLIEQLKAQKMEIEALKLLVCTTNLTAKICE
jgi:hypothetical protein